MDQLARRGEDEEAQLFGPCGKQLRGQGQPLERGQQVEGQHCQAQPGSVGAEVFGRHHAAGQFVLDHIMRRFDRAGFLAMPLQQFAG